MVINKLVNYCNYFSEIQATGKIPPALIELRLVQNKKVIEEPVIEINAVEIKTP